MKFLHTSDWHLGMNFRGGISYALDQKFAIEKICEVAVAEKVDGILLAGDVFDKSIASTEAIHIYDDVMTYICVTLNIPVYIIAGNHDGAERLSQCNELLKKSGLYVVGALSKTPQVVNVGDVDIYMLPWISTDKVKSVYPENADEIKSLEDAYKVVLDKYRKAFVKGHKNILISHSFIVDAETSVSDRAAEVGRATMIGSFVFDGFDYVALGHLHGPQQISKNVRYSGTPMAFSFGKEEKQEKSVTIIDTDTWENRIVPLPQLHKRTTLTGTFDELMKADFDKEILEGYVRLEVTDSYVGLDSIAAVREKYKNLLEVSSKGFDRDDTKITMTVEDLERADTNPESVFEQYCKDIIGEEPSGHLMELFRDALKEYEKEVVEE
ncbi:MAG: exonuclease SbcCD subunit D [Lachnospiraceae bacterium]|nr:exonuclease SbcCD subunit D [Lachnospiraceae bacterium]